MTQFYVIRHAQTDFNAQGRIQGQYDSQLNALGQQQAQTLAQKFAYKNIAAFYSSDLSRCVQTATPLAQKLGLDLQLDPTLREKHFGIFQLHSHAEAQQKFPEVYHAYQQRDLYYCLPEGESQVTFANRIITGLQQIATRHPNDKVLIMTHGGAIASLLQHTLHLESGGLRHFQLINLGVNIFNYAPQNGWELVMFGLNLDET